LASQSPDLNPIENVWSHLKLRLKHRKVYPRTKEQLWGYVQEEWAQLPVELLMNLATSMKKRCQDVIAAQGGPIDY
jgi:transposase